MRSTLVILLFGISLCSPFKANAQAWIGELAARRYNQAQRTADCVTGKAIAEKEVEPARNATILTMNNYWLSVRAGKATIVAPYFSLKDTPIWADMGEETLVDIDNMVVDRFAKSGAVMAEQPIAFFRAGDGLSASGRWAIRNAQNALIGIYDTEFKPGKNGWLLTKLLLINYGEYVDPLVQYCHHKGDVITASFLRLRTEFKEAIATTQKLSLQTEDALRTSFLRRSQAYDAPHDANEQMLADQAEAASDRLGRLLEDAAEISITKIKLARKLEDEEAAAASIETIWAGLSK
jgi:hypothetical protein